MPPPADRPTTAGSETSAAGAGAGAGAPADPLDELTRRVRAAQEAAERIVSEARAAPQDASGPVGREDGPGGGGDRRPPSSGYASSQDRAAGSGRSAEAEAVAAIIELGRGLVPAELRQAIADLVRELLLLLRAVIDWYLERLEVRRRTPVEVEDIPIS